MTDYQPNPKAQTDYRALKRLLTPFYHFDFNNPPRRKDADFTRAQKALLTRRYNELAPVLNKRGELSPDLSFVRYPPGKTVRIQGADVFYTNKGFLVKYQGASLRKVRGKNEYRLELVPVARVPGETVEKRRDVFWGFPERVVGDINAIEKWVAELKAQHKPHYIRWSKADSKESVEYTPERFNLYITRRLDIDYESEYEDSPYQDELTEQEFYRIRSTRRKFFDNDDFYNGVFFVYFPKTQSKIDKLNREIDKKKPKKKPIEKPAKKPTKGKYTLKFT